MTNLPEIDVSEIIDELDIETKARDEGRKDQPNKSRTDLDHVEHQILNYMTDLRNRGRTKAEQTALDLQNRFAEIDLETSLREIRELPEYILLQVDRELTKHREELIELRKTERVRRRELNAFERENNLKNQAEYPDSLILHWSIVIAMVLTESIANSYFFAKGSDLGLVGGVLQALLISVVNIGAGLLAGNYLLRYLHHRVQIKQFFAWVFLGLYTCFVFAFNLAAAHYRALLEIDPLTALVKVFTSLRKGPFAFDNFDAVILLSIGIIFALLAVIKSYRADAYYPRHGLMDRRYKESENAYRDAKEDAWQAAYEKLDEGSRFADDCVKKARSSTFEQPVILDHIDQLSESYLRFNQELQEALTILLKTYRNENQNVRTSPSPVYFSSYPTLAVNSELPLTRYETDRAKGSQTDNYVKKIEEETSKFSMNLRNLNKNITADIETFITNIEDAADEEISDDASSRASSKSS